MVNEKEIVTSEVVDGGSVSTSESTKKDKKTLVFKILKIALDVLIVLFVAFAVFSLVIVISSKNSADGTPTVFGTQLRIVISDSMGACDQTDVSNYKIKSIPVKSCVFVETVPEDEAEKEKWYSNIEVGDVLTFQYYGDGIKKKLLLTVW